MPQFLFDTDHLTLYQYGHPALIQRYKSYPGGTVGLSPVTVQEVLRGRLAKLAKQIAGPARIQAYARLVEAVELFAQLPIVPFNQASEDQFQQLWAMRLRIGTNDLKIGAVALAHNLTLLTRNRRDFIRIPGLILDDLSI
jgi:tRNA(fMet)-specific endonuclease VapC